MKKIAAIAAAENFSAANVGKLAGVGEYLLEFGP